MTEQAQQNQINLVRILNKKVLGKKLLATTALTMASVLASASSAYAQVANDATPVGIEFLNGTTGTVGQTGNDMVVTMDQARTIMKSQTHDIGVDASVEYAQTSTDSIAVMNVVGSVNATQILGKFTSTVGGDVGGKIFLLDPNGVFFGANSVIDVGSIVASTGQLKNLDAFMLGGVAELGDFANGTITNESQAFTVHDAGLAAFVAPTVVNSGVITAHAGKVVLASGETALLDFYGDGLINIAVDGATGDAVASTITNTGTIDIQDGGALLVSAGDAREAIDGLINMGGIVNANSVTAVGGKIVLQGADAAVEITGTITANGVTAADGGDVSITGNSLLVDTAAKIETQGGNIELVADTMVINDTVDAGTGTVTIGRATAGIVSLGTPAVGLHLDQSELENIDAGSLVVGRTGVDNNVTQINVVDVDTTSATVTGLVQLNALNGEDAGVQIVGGLKTASLEVNANDDIHLSTATVETTTGDIAFNADADGVSGAATVDRFSVFGGAVSTVTAAGDVTVSANDYVDLGADTEITANGGIISLIRSRLGTIGLGGAAGNMQVSQAELDNLSADSLVVGDANVATSKTTSVNVGGVDLTSFTDVALNALAASTVNFTGVNLFANLVVDTGQAAGDEINVDGTIDATGDVDFTTNTADINADITADTIHIDAPNVDLNADLDANSITGTATAVNVESNSAQIQDGIDVAASGAIVDVGAGKYNEAVEVDKALTLRGAQVGVATAGRNANNDAVETIVQSSDVGVYVTAAGVTVDGFVVSGGEEGLYVDGVDGTGSPVVIQNNILTGQDEEGILVKASKYVDILANLVTDSDDDGIKAKGSSHVTISGNTVDGTDDDGIVVSNGSDYYVLNNVVTDVEEDGIEASNVLEASISGNEISDAGNQGIELSGSDLVTIQNNVISDVDDEAIDIDGSGGVWVLDNKLTGDNAEIGISLKDGAGIRLYNNDIEDFEIGVKVDGTATATIGGVTLAEGNTITSVDYGVVANDASGLIVQNNSMTGNSVIGIDVDSSNGAIIDNNDVDNFETGIQVVDSEDVLVDRNKVTNTDETAINVEGSKKIIVKRNKIETATAGVVVEGSNGAKVNGNNIDDISGHAINVSNSNNAKINRNKIDDVDGNAIVVANKKSVTITDNEIGQNAAVAGDAVSISGSADATITGNIANVGGDGVIFNDAQDDAEIVITGNTIVAGKSAVVLGGLTNGTTVAVNGNTELTGLVGGVRISGDLSGASTVAVSDNTKISGGTADGVYVADTGAFGDVTVDVENNVDVTSTAGNGIAVNNTSNTTIAGNTVHDTGAHGVSVIDAAGAQVIGNGITNAGASGVFIDPSPGAVVAGNTITDSATNGVHVLDSDNVTVGGLSLADANIITGGKTGVRVENSDGVKVWYNTISNLLFSDGNGIGDAVNLDNSDNAWIWNNTITNVFQDGVDFENGSDNGRVSRNTITNARDVGVEARNSNNIEVVYNVINGAGNGIYGVKIFNSSENAQVNYNTISSFTETGIYLDSQNGDVFGNVISNDGTGTGIRVENSDNVEVGKGGFPTDPNRNTITNVATGIAIVNGADVKVDNNKVFDADYGIVANDVTLLSVTDNNVDGGYVADDGIIGIKVTGGSTSTVGGAFDGNLVDDFDTGIQMNDVSGFAVAWNWLTSVHYGIDINGGTGGTVTNNNITGNSITGIHVQSHDGIEVDGNVLNTFDDGIVIDDSENAKVRGNVLSNIDDDGIRIIEGSHGSYVGGNRVNDAGSDAADQGVVVLRSNNTTVFDNNIRNAHTGVASFQSNGVTIDDNDIQFVTNGIYAADSSDLTIVDNEIDAGHNGRAYGDYGINVVRGTDIEIDGNDVDDFETGIKVANAANVEIDDNEVTDADYGIVSRAVTGFLKIFDNNIDAYDASNPDAPGVDYKVGIDVQNVDGTEVQIGSGSGDFGSRDSNGNLVDDFETGIKVVGGNDVKIDNNRIHDARVVGIDVDDVDAEVGKGRSWIKGLFVTDNEVDGGYNGHGTGIRVTNSKNAQIGGKRDGNTVTNTDLGIHVVNSFSVDVDQNTVSKIDGDGIFVQNSDYADIEGNDVSHVDGHGISVNPSDNIEIIGNYVYDADQDGIHVYQGENAEISNNYIDEVGDDGIHVEENNGAKIADNKINTRVRGANTDDDGIYVKNSRNVEVTGNVVDDSDDNGIKLRNTDHVKVKGNTVTDAHTGIKLTDSGTFGADIDNNTIRNVEYGIYADTVSFLNIEDNNIDGRYHQRGMGHVGIFVKDSHGARIGGYDFRHWNSDGNTVKDFNTGIKVINSHGASVGYNEVSEFGDYGIKIVNSNYVATYENEVYDGYGTGIALYGTHYNTVADNEVYAVDGDGVFVSGWYNWATGNVVKDNDISDIGGDGVRIQYAKKTTVAGNKIKYVDGDGVSVANSKKTGIFANWIGTFFSWGPSIGHDGVYVEDSSETVVAHNVIHNVGSDGVDISSGEGTLIKKNWISGAGDNGVEVSDSNDTTIDRNVIEHVRNDGVQVGYSEFTSILENLIKHYGDDGVQLANSNNADIIDNTIIGNPFGFNFNTGIRIGSNEGGPHNYFENLFSGSRDVTIAYNNIMNNFIGLKAGALNNGYIDVASNTFTNNFFGMWINSGLIDLTHVHTVDEGLPTEREVGNTFIGGLDAMVFSGDTAYEDFEAPEFDGPSFDGPQEPVRLRELPPKKKFGQPTGLSLVGDTLGNTVFENQQGYYVHLMNGALFNPGTPTIIDGTLATYDGVSGGLMTQAQLDAIEAKLKDFDDDGTLGQIFAGFVSFDDDTYKNFLDVNYRAGRSGITILGRPFGGGFGGGQNLSIQDLANLAPAAGGDDNGAAEGGCWGQLGALGGAGAMNISMDSSPTSILADQAACDGS